jgi:feruloyl-CoA synthase
VAAETTATTLTFAVPRISAERRADGTLRIWSDEPLQPTDPSVASVFRRGSEEHPERLLLAERGADGWRETTWGQARAAADSLVQAFLDRGVGDRPIMVLSGNSRSHLLVTLAAYTLGVPVVPASVAYSLQSTDHAKLRTMADLTDPGVVYADDAAAFGPALAAVGADRLVLTGPELEPLLATVPTAEVGARCAANRPDDVAKILFTSGSTGTPKGVLTTNGMLTANQQQMRQAWPFLADEPPVLLDWLPWSHTFGGNHNLGMILANGGSLWIDDGKPVPGLVERTVRNLADVSPTMYFNVPAGYAAMVPILERDDEAAALFFARLRLGFFAAAALPQQLWDRLEALAARHGSGMRMTTSWGLTETSPAATTTHFAVTRSDCLGVPLPGVELKLVPTGGKTEVRLRGPNITPGYHRRPDLTAAAFDDEGYLCTGDAVELADPGDVSQGLLFRGRIAEDFKLSTGTFVSVGTLRPALLSASGGIISDAVICGQDGDFVGALIWLHPDHAARCDDDGTPAADLRADLDAALQRLAASGGGSSQRVERVLVLREPPALDAGEITDKGYVNQRAVRDRRADHVARLLADPCDPRVVERSRA